MILSATLLATFLHASTASATGGDVSGGGELLEDRINPWFVQEGTVPTTKKIVSYCLIADESAFGVSMSDLEKQVQNAFRFWQDELAAAYLPANSPTGGQVLVGAESFFQASTCENARIIFQFGVLTNEQLTDFKNRELDPTNFVALAMRTKYDPASMQGTGYVYIAPPRGPLAMHGRDIVPDTWATDSNLRLSGILAHELGHVFGLQHDASREHLMGAEFPERIVTKGSGWTGFIPGIFKVPMNVDRVLICSETKISNFLLEFFSAPADAACITAIIRQNRMILSSRRKREGTSTKLGEIQFESELLEREESLIDLWLPSERYLFKNVATRFGRILPGPTVRHRQVAGTFFPAASPLEHQRSVQVHLSPARIQVGGVWNGKVVLDVFNLTKDQESQL